ncbi:MAG TPA: hypothetical protein VG015_09610 [Candidatus Dormibacteraeota bacterium]|jgi:hypothetical protein|nr:hypothetical protein [Candidatus Dormibacteraeota bacterium]
MSNPIATPAGPPAADSTNSESRQRWKITERTIQVILGIFWLLDGALQLQPYFFSNGFVHDMVGSMATGQPTLVGGPIVFMVNLVQPAHVLFNAGFAAIQIILGLGLILSQRWVKATLVASFIWTLVVWWFGEGLGMLAMGAANPLTGAPGAVVLYAIIGYSVWPTGRQPGPIAASAGPLGEKGARAAWGLLWLLDAGLMLLPVNRDPDAFKSILTVAANQTPGALSTLDGNLAHLLSGQGTIAAMLLAILMATIGVAVSINRASNLCLALGSVLAIFFWITTEYLGGMLTGQGTDPNSGPLIVLLALGLYNQRRPLWVGRER